MVGSDESRHGFELDIIRRMLNVFRHARNRTDKLEHVGKRLGVDGVAHPRSILAALDQPGVTQNFQVMGDRRLLEIEVVFKLANADIITLLTDELYHSKPNGMPQRLQRSYAGLQFILAEQISRIAGGSITIGGSHSVSRSGPSTY